MGSRHLHNRNRLAVTQGEEMIQYFDLRHAMGHWHEAGEQRISELESDVLPPPTPKNVILTSLQVGQKTRRRKCGEQDPACICRT